MVWKLAKATLDADLLDACFSFVAAGIRNVISNVGLLCELEIEDIMELMQGLLKKTVTEESKVKLIASWLSAPKSDAKQFYRIQKFDQLITTIRMDQLSPIFMIQLAAGKVDFPLFCFCKAKLIETWETSTSRSFFHYSALDDSIGYASIFLNISTRPNILYAFGTNEALDSLTFSTIPQLQHSDDVILHMYNVSGQIPVMLKGRLHRLLLLVQTILDTLYLIGGKDSRGNAILDVSKIDLHNGNLTTASSVKYPRIGSSVVAYGQYILVFGGYDQVESQIISSCEIYDTQTDRLATFYFESL